MKRAGNIEERYFLAPGFDQFGLTGSNFISFGDFYKLWHRISASL
jgi:hypothetical protein